MNPLVAKEIRQLRPALAAALLLAVVPVWLYPADWNSRYHAEGVLAVGTMSFFVGWLLLALTCFGREFGMGTFPVLLGLPVARERIWWTKITVLLCAMVIALAAAAGSAFLWYVATNGLLVWENPRDNNLDHEVAAVILAFAVIVASGLWTTLFLRQMLAAFWFAIVVPIALLMLASWGGQNVLTGEIVLGLYAVAGFLLAQRLFYRAQEVAWTGGEVNLPTLRSASAAGTAAGRSYHPLVALIGKELQLYKIPLAGVAAMFLTAFCLAYFNFRRLSEARRLWLRNLGSFACVLILMPGLVAAIYYRAWEYLTPLEPARGPAKLTLASPPRLQFDWRTISVFMPDGRVWSRRIAYQAAKQIKPFGENMPVSLGAGRWIMAATDDFDAGSNWAALTHNRRESVAIRADGTLWLSTKPQQVFENDEEGRLLKVNAHESLPMVRFGGETDWKDVTRVGGDTVMLLKRDGTIWHWGYDHTGDFPGLASMQPVRAGKDSDWGRFLGTAMGAFAWKNDGRAWEVTTPSTASGYVQNILAPGFVLLRQKNLDNMKVQRMAWSQSYFVVACDDGTLWVSGQPDRFHRTGEAFDLPWTQVGTETNWISVTGGNKLVALKRDGTLWKWNTQPETFPSPNPFRNPPERLGTHDDWVALGSFDCALAADGSLWFWENGFEASYWLAPTRKPYKLGNVFAQ